MSANRLEALQRYKNERGVILDMKRTLIVLAVISLFLVTACAPQIPVNKVLPPREPQPPQPPVLTKSFEEMYWNAECADIKNEFFFIQDRREYANNRFVFRNREGDCPDNRFEQTLFRGENVACSRSDSIAGVQESCNDERSRQMFSTIINNLNKPDFGLGQQYTVTKMTFELEGSEIPFEEIEIPCTSLEDLKGYVVRTQQEYEMLSANIDCGTLPPKIDFTEPTIECGGCFKTTLLGFGARGCTNDYQRMLTYDSGTKEYTYSLTLEQGLCEMVNAWTGNWIITNKIPPDATIKFRYHQMPIEPRVKWSTQ